MKFGKRLQIHIEETLPEWRDKFLSYKPLKKRLKKLSAPECFAAVGFCASSPPHEGVSTSVVDTAIQELWRTSSVGVGGNVSDERPLVEEAPAVNLNFEEAPRVNLNMEEAPRVNLNMEEAPRVNLNLSMSSDTGTDNDEASSQSSVHNTRNTDRQAGMSEEEEFINLVNEELEKFNNFFLEKEEEYVIYLQELKERIERLKDKSKQNGGSTSENEFNEETVKIRRDIVAIHGEMVLLENYSALNFTGLVKILKKYDKRTGTLLRLPFIQNVLKQPFFTTEVLSKLVCECEANLQSIFPTTPLDRIGEDVSVQIDENSTENLQETLPLQGDTVDNIYRSTLAALRTIKDLRKGSSTYNPLSFASFAPRDVEDRFLDSISASQQEAGNNTLTEENIRPTDRSNAAQTSYESNGEQKEVSVP